MTVRSILKEDREYLLEIIRNNGIFTDTEITFAIELLDFCLKGHSEFITGVAVNKQNMAVGHICYSKVIMSDGLYDLHFLSVDPGEQRKGIGQKLIQWMEANVIEAGGRVININCSSRPVYTPAFSFFKKMGYQKSIEIPDFYSEGENKIIFFKRFNSKVFANTSVNVFFTEACPLRESHQYVN